MSEKRTETKEKVQSAQADMEVLEQILSQPQAEIESLEGLLAKLPEADQKKRCVFSMEMCPKVL